MRERMAPNWEGYRGKQCSLGQEDSLGQEGKAIFREGGEGTGDFAKNGL